MLVARKPFKVLVTRPANLAHGLIESIEKAGFTPELLPVIEFKPAADQNTLVRTLQNLPKIDIAIFVSAAAVQYGMQVIHAYWSRPPDILYIGIGPATLKALQLYSLNRMIAPKNPPFESETLLELPMLENVQSKHIVIFRGNGGRDLLANSLKARGAILEVIECYQRQIPKINIANHLNIWYQEPPHAILVTSAQCLVNLKTLTGEKAWKYLQSCPIIVVGLRMQALAATLGITEIIVAKAADDASLTEALMNFRDKIQ